MGRNNISLKDAYIVETLLSNRSEEHTSELQSRFDLVCRLLLEKKKNIQEKTRGMCQRGTDDDVPAVAVCSLLIVGGSDSANIEDHIVGSCSSALYMQVVIVE